MMPSRDIRYRQPGYWSFEHPGRFAAGPMAGRTADYRALATIRVAAAKRIGPVIG